MAASPSLSFRTVTSLAMLQVMRWGCSCTATLPAIPCLNLGCRLVLYCPATSSWWTLLQSPSWGCRVGYSLSWGYGKPPTCARSPQTPWLWTAARHLRPVHLGPRTLFQVPTTCSLWNRRDVLPTGSFFQVPTSCSLRNRRDVLPPGSFYQVPTSSSLRNRRDVLPPGSFYQVPTSCS